MSTVIEFQHQLVAPTPLDIAGVGLAVRDLESVLTFYREVVGLELIGQAGDRVLL